MRWLAVVVLAAGFASACEKELPDEHTVPFEAGAADAGVDASAIRLDASVVLDASTARDAGVAADAALVADGGALDAGAND